MEQSVACRRRRRLLAKGAARAGSAEQWQVRAHGAACGTSVDFVGTSFCLFLLKRGPSLSSLKMVGAFSTLLLFLQSQISLF
eukprot:6206808-Pleurochrysis_carterae.AAC.1